MPKWAANPQLAALRNDRGLSQAELGALVVPPTGDSEINKLEKGHVKLTQEWIYRLARALECHPGELYRVPARALSVEEQVVIERYRGLSDADRQAAFRVIDAMAKSKGSQEPTKN